MLQARLRCRPNAVRLENRDVPTLVIWTGVTGNGQWSDPGNWDKMKVPMDGDDVIVNDTKTVFFNSAAGNINLLTLDCKAPFTIDGGTLGVSAEGTFTAAVTQSGGAFAGTGLLMFNSTLTSTGGAMLGIGTTVLNNAWNLTTNGVSYTMTNRTVNVAGLFTWAGNADLLTGTSSGDGLFTLGGSSTSFLSANANWNKAGGFTKAMPITVEGGAKVNFSGANIQYQGQFDAFDTAAINFDSTSLTFFAGGIWAADFTGNGSVNVSGGIVALFQNASIQISGQLNVTSGQLRSFSGTPDVKNLTMTGGTLLAVDTSPLLVTGGFNWMGGDLNKAIVVLDTKTTNTIQSTAPTPLMLIDSSIINKGTVTWTGGVGIDAGGTTWNNADGGTFKNTSAGTLTNVGSATPFMFRNNLGAVYHHAHTGLTTIQGPFTNDGTIIVDKMGSLRLAGGLTNLVGGMLNAGTYDLPGKLLVPGALVTDNRGNFSINGNTGGIFDDVTLVNAFKSLSVNSGILNVTGNSSFSLNGPLTNSGKITIDAGSLLQPIGAFTQNSGTIAVNGTLDPTGQVNLNGGRLQGVGFVNANVFNNGGKVSPGNSPGPMTFNGNYVQNGDFEVEIFGPTAGFDYDQLIVNGTVTLGGNLLLTRFYNALVGETFTILVNDLSDDIVNIFLSLPENGIINANGERFRITYKGGDGNDVALTRLATGVGSITIGDGKQCSMVNSLTIDFNGLVDLPSNPADAFSLKRKSDGMVVNLSGVTASNSETTTATLGFTGGAMEFKSLADGRYTLILNATMATDPGGEFIDGDNNGSTGGDYMNTTIKRYFGDIDCDGDADTGDFGQFRGSFGGSNFGFDIDGDGDVDTGDFNRFRGNFGGSV